MYRATCSKLCKLVGIIAWIINMYPYLYHFHSEWIFSSFKQSFRRTFQGRIPQNSMGKKDVTQFIMKKIDQLNKQDVYFFAITQYNSNTHNACTLTFMNLGTQTLPLNIFEDWVGKSSGLTKSPQGTSNRRERRLPLKSIDVLHF